MKEYTHPANQVADGDDATKVIENKKDIPKGYKLCPECMEYITLVGADKCLWCQGLVNEEE